MFIDSSLWQSSKALFPITVKEFGIFMLSRFLQPESLQLIVYQFVLIKNGRKEIE